MQTGDRIFIRVPSGKTVQVIFVEDLPREVVVLDGRDLFHVVPKDAIVEADDATMVEAA